MNTSSITIKLKNKEKQRLLDLALFYGISLKELLEKIISQISSEIPEESIKEYQNPQKIKKSLDKALTDYKKGHFYSAL